MSELITYRLDEIADVIDCEHKTAPKVDSSEYYSIRTPDIKNGRLLYEQANRVSAETYELWTKRGIPEAGDIILAREAPVGEVGWIDKDHKICLGQRTVLIKIRSSQIEKKYLLYSFVSPKFKDYLNELSGGSVVAHLNMKDIRALEFSFPPLPEQKAIASVLSSLDDKIDLLHRQNKTLEAMAETLFRQWFIEEAKEDWEEVTLADVCTRITDGSHSSPASVEEGYPMASVKDMYDWGINQATCRKISKEDYEALVQADCKALQGDILIAKDGSYLKHVFLLEESLDVVLLSSIAMLRPNGRYNPMLLTLFLKLDSTHESMQNIVTGAVIPRIVLKDFRKFPIQLPPKDLQDKAIGIVKPIFDKCWENNRQIQTLENLRDTLLSKLMSGEVRVQYQTEEVA